MMRITGRAFLVLSFIAGCLLFAGGPTTAREVSVSNIIVAQSSSTGTTKKWTTKKDNQEGKGSMFDCVHGPYHGESDM